MIALEPLRCTSDDGGRSRGANDGFPRTDTTDRVLLSVNMALELDDGAEVVLSPGDVLDGTELGTVGASWRRAVHPGFFSSSDPPPLGSFPPVFFGDV